MQEKLSRIPSIESLLQRLNDPVANGTNPNVRTWIRSVQTRVAQSVCARVREEVKKGAEVPPVECFVQEIRTRLEALSKPSMQPVLNATGVLIHTNLGRAPLGKPALLELSEALSGYSTLEFDLEKGERGSRTSHLEELLSLACEAPAALAVNNNAAAIFLLLHAFAAGREVIVSRGELVQIGGGFRVPDILRASGARLVEVGTTNMTALSDYEKAIGPQTALLLKVHQSNFVQHGHTAEVTCGELSRLAHKHGLLSVMDLGSGCLLDQDWDCGERKVADYVREGVRLLCFSGDKLLGGPQAGILLGEKALLDRLRTHPLYRALRLGKLEVFLLERVLLGFLRGEKPLLWNMLEETAQSIQQRAMALKDRLSVPCRLESVTSAIGGGSMPGGSLPSWALIFEHPEPENFAKRLRAAHVVAGMESGKLRVDLRTILPGEEEALARALTECY